MPSPAKFLRKFAILLGAIAFLFCVSADRVDATITNTSSSVTAQGNNVTTAFSYNFPISSAAYVVVQVVNTNVSPSTIATLSPSQYTITGIGTQSGGTVTYPLSGSPLAPGYFIVISRIVPLIQTTSIASQGPTFRAIENALDYLTEITQQLQAQITVLQAEISGGTVIPPVYTGRFITSGTTDNAFTTDTTIVWESASAGAKSEFLYPCDSSVAWRTLLITDGTGTFGTYSLTITPNGSNTIGGASSYVLPFNRQSATLQCDGAGAWLPQ